MRATTATPAAAAKTAVAYALAGIAAYAALANATAPPASAASASASASSASSASSAGNAGSVTRSAHVAFENCNAQHIVLSVSAPTRAFTPGQPVAVTVQFRNTGSTVCGSGSAAGAQAVPRARQKLTVGPCGSLSLVVRSRNGIAVYPGPTIFNCPDESGLRLGPHSTVQATAIWSQIAYGGSPAKPRQAPPGTYRVVVDGAVTVPVTLAQG